MGVGVERKTPRTRRKRVRGERLTISLVLWAIYAPKDGPAGAIAVIPLPTVITREGRGLLFAREGLLLLARVAGARNGFVAGLGGEESTILSGLVLAEGVGGFAVNGADGEWAAQ